MLRREVPAGSTVVATSTVDVVAALAFLAGLVTAVLIAVSRVWIAPAAVVVLATVPRRSTRPIAWWTLVGVAVGVIVLALVLALVAGGPHGAND